MKRAALLLCALALLPLLISCVGDGTSPIPSASFTVYNAWWSDAVDNDLDGYTAYRRLHFDVDVSSGSYSVYVVVQYKLSTASTYTTYVTTDDFTITGNEAADAYWVHVGSPNPELPHGSYDFRLRVYSGGVLVATYGPDNNAALQAQRFEPSGTTLSAYKLVNGTWADMQVWVNGVLDDTIGWRDSLTYIDDASSGSMILYLKSIVLTDNFIYWRDTITRGYDYRMRYFAGSTNFQLDIANNTNRNMRSLAVASGQLAYDSSAAFLQAGDLAEIGFYRASAYTDIRLYFYNTTLYVFWEDQITTSTTGEARWVLLEPNNILSKAAAYAADAPLKPTDNRGVRVKILGDAGNGEVDAVLRVSDAAQLRPGSVTVLPANGREGILAQ